MGVVTCNGQAGSGAREVGREVARLLGYEYVDSLIIAQAAKRVGATVEAVADKELKKLRMRDRIARFVQIMLERSAMSGTPGEPYLGTGIEALLARQYQDVDEEPITTAQQIDDKRFIEVTKAVINELAQEGNMVIVGRGSNIILKEVPSVFHVGFVASLELRVRTIMEREHLGWKEAEKAATEEEQARLAFFRKYFKVDALNPELYHLTINMANMNVKTAAEVVATAATKLLGGTTGSLQGET